MSDNNKVSLFSKKFSFVFFSLIISIMIFILLLIYLTIKHFFYPSELPPNYVSDLIVLLPGPFLTDLILLYIFPL